MAYVYNALKSYPEEYLEVTVYPAGKSAQRPDITSRWAEDEYE